MSYNSEQHKKDPQYKQAKRQGYRSRAAYKLLEIQKRYNIFKRAFYILDLGSAPGSWLQVSKEIAEKNILKYNDGFYHRNHYKILGVDLKKITPIEDINILRKDFTNPMFKDDILHIFQGEKIDLLLSDASINKSGNKFSDQARQVNLSYQILDLIDFLKFKGNMVIKLFQGADFDTFFKKMKQSFFNLKSLKPKSSYKKSNEIYLIGLKKK